MKVRLIVRVPQRLLSGRLGAVLDSSPDEEISTADTLNSLLAFDDPDYADKLNGNSKAPTEVELPEASNEPADLPHAPELAHLLEFDEIEAWSKSTRTLDEQMESLVEPFEPSAEVEEAEHLDEAADEEPGELPSSMAQHPDLSLEPDSTASEASPSDAKLTDSPTQPAESEAPEAGESKRISDAEPAAESEAGEPDPLAASQPEQVDTGDSPVSEPTAVAKTSLNETIERTTPDTAQETADSSSPGTVQIPHDRADVVRDALSAMPWWQRWEQAEESESSQASGTGFVPESETAAEDITGEADPEVVADTEPPEIQAEAAQIEQPLETESQHEGAGQPLETDEYAREIPEPSPVSGMEHAEEAEELVSRPRETHSEPVTDPSDFAPDESARPDTAPPEPMSPEAPAPDASPAASPAAASYDESYTPVTEGTDALRQALDSEQTTVSDPAANDPATIYSWSAFERPEAKVLVPLSEQVVARRRRRNIAALIAAGILVLISAGWLYKTQTDPIRAMKALESGRRQLLIGSYGEAILDLNNAISINPDDPRITDAYLLRGRAHVAMGRAEDALPDFTQAIQRNPENVTAYLDRGLAYFNVGLFNQALNDGAKIIELDDQSADGYELRGMALRETGNLEAAMEDFNQAVKLKPNLANLLQRGLLLQKLGRHEEAIQDFNEVIYMNPASPTAYFSRAQSLRELGQQDAAERDHRTARYLDGR